MAQNFSLWPYRRTALPARKRRCTPRRSILSAADRENLLALPDTQKDLIRHYSLTESDLSIIRQRRGAANLLGFAVQLCYMRYPGVMLPANAAPAPPLLCLTARQLKLDPEEWANYAARAETRREHLAELQSVFGFRSFTTQAQYRQAVQNLEELAWQTDKGVVLATSLIESLRRNRPSITHARLNSRPVHKRGGGQKRAGLCRRSPQLAIR